MKKTIVNFRFGRSFFVALFFKTFTWAFFGGRFVCWAEILGIAGRVELLDSFKLRTLLSAIEKLSSASFHLWVIFLFVF